MSIVNYATLEELKAYLGISGSDQDTILQQLLDSSYYTLNNLIGIDTFNLTTGTEIIDLDKMYYNNWYQGIYLFFKNKPVSAITKIAGETYTGVKGTDYLIVQLRKAIINDMTNYINNLNFNFVEIEYTWGYDRDLDAGVPGSEDELPDDIKVMQMMLVSGMYNTKGMEGVKEYKLGDETIKFSGAGGQSPDEVYFGFKILLDQYKTFILP